MVMLVFHVISCYESLSKLKDLFLCQHYGDICYLQITNYCIETIDSTSPIHHLKTCSFVEQSII